MQHPHDQALDALRTGEGSMEDARHVAQCERCRIAVKDLIRLAGKFSTAPLEGPSVPEQVDRAILTQATHEMRAISDRRRRVKFWVRFSAAAAVLIGVAVIIFVRIPRQTDIVDAYKLAQAVKEHRAVDAAWDSTGDGVVDFSDVQALAKSAVFVAHTRQPARQPIADRPSVRFVTFDVFVDSGASPLGAYQFELGYDPDESVIVGIEGGEPKAFSDAPYYDPSALKEDRIVIAAFTIDEPAPAGRVRVARLHLEEAGDGTPDYSVKLITAATSGGKKINAKIEIKKTGGQK